MSSEFPAVREPRFMVMSFGFTAALFVAVIVVAAISGGTAEATTYNITTTGGPIRDWNTPTTWTPNGVPGSAPGDVVNITTTNAEVQLTTSLANPLAGFTINASGVLVDVSGGNLDLGGVSSVGSAATLRVTSSGTILINASSLTIASGGQVQSTSGGGTFDGGGSGSMTIQTGGTLSLTDTTTVTNGLNIINSGGAFNTFAPLAINATSYVTNSSGSININSTAGITSDNIGTKIDVVGGTLTYSAGSPAAFDIQVNTGPGGTVSNANADLALNQGGTHQGSLQVNTPGGRMNLSGATTSDGSTWGGAPSPSIALVGGTLTLVNATNTSGGVILEGGTVQGAGAMTATGTITWKGGNINGTALTISANTMNITGAIGPMSLQGGEITTIGAGFTYTGSGAGGLTIGTGGKLWAFTTFDYTGGTNPITINSGGELKIEPGAQFNALDDAPINGSGTGVFNMAGTYVKQVGGISNSTVNAVFNNTGTVGNSASGTSITLSNGGIHAGVFNTVVGGTTITFGGGTHQFLAGSSFTGLGTFSITGGTFDLDVAASIPATASFTLAGGVQTGAGNFTVGGPATWSGGTIDASSGGGSTDFNVTLAISGVAQKTHNQRTINNTGTATWTGGNISSGFSAVFNNTGTFNIQCDRTYFFNLSGSQSSFNNSGTFTKSVTTGTTTFGITHNQTAGSMTISTGTFTFNNGFGSFTGGTVSASSGATLNFNSGDAQTFGAASTVNGAGTIGFVGGATTVSGTYSVTGNTSLTGGTALFAASATTTQLTLSSGTIAGAGTLTVTGAATWTGGNMSGSGGTTTFQAGSTLAISGATAKTHIFRTINNAGTVTWSGGNIDTGLGAIFSNTGTFNIQTDNSYAFNQGGTLTVFNNSGTVTKSVTTGTTNLNIAYNQGAGSTTVSTGSVTLSNGGAMSAGGTLATGAGALLDFTGGTFAVNAGGFSGTGQTRVAGGTLQINGNLSALTTLAVGSGVLEVTGSSTFQITTLLWTGGALQNTGTTRVFGGSIGNTAPTSMSGSHTLTIPGASFTYSADNVNYLTISDTSNLNVEFGGSFSMTADGIIAGVSPASVTNTGTLRKTGGAGASRIDPPFTSTGGTVGATSGTLHLKGGGALTATIIDTGVAAKVQFEGNYNINAGSSVAGTGTVQITSGTVTIAPNVTIQTFILDGGILAGAGNILAKGGSWSGGDMNAGGTFTVFTGSTFTIGSPTLKKLQRAFTNDGTVNLATAAILQFENGITFTNNGTLDFQSDAAINCACGTPSTLVNNATRLLTKSGGTGASNIAAVVNNDGNVSVTSSALQLNFNNGGTHTGNFTGVIGASLGFSGGTHAFGAASSVNGSVSILLGGTANIAGTYSVASPGTTMIYAGTSTFSNAGGAQTARLLLNGGTLAGSAAFTITGGTASQWISGTIMGTGAFTINSGSQFQLVGGGGPMLLDGRSITNNGTLVYSSAADALTLDNAASIINGNIFQVSVANPINVGVGGGTIQNNSAFTRLGAAGNSTIAPAFTNASVVFLQAGTTTFNSFTQTAGTLNLAGGNMASGTTVTIGSGDVTGNGTITANLSNGGAILPGAGLVTGTITIAGTYTQLGTGKLEVDIGGTAPGTQYDVLNTTGQPALAGELKVNLINAFIPANGNTFDILGYTTQPVTDFTTNNLPSFGAGGSFTRTYLPANLQLTTVIPSTDVTIAQATSGLAHTNDPVTFTVTVTNTGTFAANAVSLTNNLSGPFTFVSSSTTLGSCTGTNCNLGNLAPGAGAVVTLNLTATGPGTITNSASSTSTTLDPNGANNTSIPASVTVTARADVSVSVTDAPDPVNATANVVYTITLNNAGPNTAASPAVALSVANGAITATTGPLTCSGSTTSQNCSAATLALGVTTMTVTVQAGAQGTTSLTASYTSPTFDNNTADNSATQSTAITPKADLAITKNGPVSTTPGTLAYTVTITNNGPSDAAAVTVVDPTPAGSTFVSNSGACTTPYPCSLGTLISGATATINSTYTIPSNASGSITNTATVTSTTADPNTANNTATITTPVNQIVDMQITKTGPTLTTPGSVIDYAIVVKNNGPSDAGNVTVTDPTPAQTTLLGVSGACTAFPCSLGTVTSGQSKVISASYQVSANASGSITNTASVTTSTIESNPSNDSSTVSTVTECPTALPTLLTPVNDATGAGRSGRLFWDNVNAPFYSIYLGRADANGCNVPFTESNFNFVDYFDLQPNTKYAWRVEAITSGCPPRSSTCQTFTTGANCNATLTLVKPLSGTATSPVEFEWQPISAATEYAVFARVGNASFAELGKTASTKLTASLVTDGTVQWFVVATIPGCGNVQSPTASFTMCNRPATPLARVIGEATSAKTYSVEWDAVPNAIRYELDEATNAAFTDAVTTSTDKTSLAFKHDATTTALAFHYRIRAFTACSPTASDNSPSIRIVIIPLPNPQEQNPNTNIPAGSTELVVQQVFIPGETSQPAFFTAVTDRPWLTVRPPNGILPPEGITLEVVADPANLPNGTFTATVIVTITTPGAAGITGHGTSTSSKPISISLVTPVTPVQNKLAPSADALIIPSVGHLDGINSHWQSDIRVTNVSAVSSKYALTFTPSAGTASGIKQTTITVGGGETTALDDIIKNWFGIGSLGDTANGMLEIRSADSAPLTAVASSRTYNVTSNGTLGQYIPALPFSGFVGKALQNAAPTILSMQQISQSSLYRTNVGIVEASGKAASVIMSVFNAAGVKLTDIPLELAGGEQRQLNSILAANNITLNDGRVEVKVAGGDGKVTAYASVVDNQTNDPLLVSGVATNQLGSAKYVLPGVADLTNALANWRTDMRIFNTTLASQTASLTLHQLGGGTPLTASVSLQPGEVRTLDDVVKSLFNVSNVGGAVHVEASNQANLVVTGRTYNQTSAGTFGQFIEAVTPERAVGAGGRTLHVLQVEDSIRYRTNLGIAEVTGSPVTVEVQVVLPDSKVTPTLTFPMAANEFRQLSIIRDLSLGNVYNARLTVKVIDGQGRVTAYGSVIDMTTQDPTYVPAQ